MLGAVLGAPLGADGRWELTLGLMGAVSLPWGLRALEADLGAHVSWELTLGLMGAGSRPCG